MAAPRKIFRIEETAAMRIAPPVEHEAAARRHAEIMNALAALRALLAAAPPPRLRGSLERPRSHAEQMTRVDRELDAVRKNSETATQKILAAAEEIDQAANDLSASLKSAIERGLAHDIRDRVVQIFEACNFQDLIGQRVATVMTSLGRIEQQMTRTLEEHTPANAPAVHGPRIEGDRGHISQAEIDTMFGARRRSA